MELDILVWAGTTFAALIPLVNPLNAVPLFAVMTGDLTDEERKRQATKAGIYAGVILVVTAVAGIYILDFFGINLGMLQIAGGLIVAQAAWAMVTGNPQASQTETATWAHEKRFSLRRGARVVAKTVETRDVSHLKQHWQRPKPEKPEKPAPAPEPAEAEASPDFVPQPMDDRPPANAADIAFSPVAMPLLAGPASMGVVVGLTSQSTTFGNDIGIFLGIALITVIAVYGLRASTAILHTLGASGILALQRIFGFILLSIAVALVANGISALFGIPIYTE